MTGLCMNNNMLLFLLIRFVLQPVSHIRKELSEKLQSNEEKIKSIEVAICNCECAHTVVTSLKLITVIHSHS